jgi:predicted nuclease with TOPRIM domain
MSQDINTKEIYDCEGCREKQTTIDTLENLRGMDWIESHKKLEEKDKEIAELKAELDDIKTAHNATMDEVCSDITQDNRQHCSCVPFLRKEITSLQNQLTERENEICLKAGEIAELKAKEVPNEPRQSIREAYSDKRG